MSQSPLAPERRIDWQAYVPTEKEGGWGGERSQPPAEAGADEWERWRQVRLAIRTNDRRGLPVDQVRRLQRRIRLDRKMTSTHGEFDPLTVIAIMWYQADYGLPPSGILDAPTVQSLIRKWPELKRHRQAVLERSTVLLTGDTPELQRFLYYRNLVLEHGALFDDGHLDVNLLVIRNATVERGPDGVQVRFTDAGGTNPPYVTVSLWVEREGDDDEGDVADLVVRERPGCVRPIRVRSRNGSGDFAGGQYICDLGKDEPHLAHAQAFISTHPVTPGCIPAVPEPLPLREGAIHETSISCDLEQLSYDRFVTELVTMRRSREIRGSWRGVRILLLDASQLQPAF